VWHRSFPEFIAEENLPLDQFTFHHSILAVRVDYRADGEYTHAVLFHGPYRGSDLYDRRGDATNPWGTQRPADEVVGVGGLARFQVPLAASAPPDWEGTAHITFILQNAGPGGRTGGRSTSRGEARPSIGAFRGSRARSPSLAPVVTRHEAGRARTPEPPAGGIAFGGAVLQSGVFR
jgi:hypothetical protein